MIKSYVLAIIISAFLPTVRNHGRLIEPPSRATAWRYGFSTPPNYNDHELYCGGFTRQWVTNEGKCGVCGDPWDTKLPRPHEYRGTYGRGDIVRRYKIGQEVTIRVELTASHLGYFEFALCSDYKNTSQVCLDKNVLKLARPQEDVEHGGTRFYPRNGTKIYDMKYRLPEDMICRHCVLQWRYVAGNNWGNCPNGTGMVGCGPQEEFRACADVAIQERGPAFEPATEEYPEETTTITTTTTTTSTTSTTPLKPEETYNPVTALIISVVSFLVISLVFFLLYFHYYQVGRQIKNWVKARPVDDPGECHKNVTSPTPLPPPRMKRNKCVSEGAMHVIDLKDENFDKVIDL